MSNEWGRRSVKDRKKEMYRIFIAPSFHTMENQTKYPTEEKNMEERN